jgi:hypothetical protein
MAMHIERADGVVTVFRVITDRHQRPCIGMHPRPTSTP